MVHTLSFFPQTCSVCLFEGIRGSGWTGGLHLRRDFSSETLVRTRYLSSLPLLRQRCQGLTQVPGHDSFHFSFASWVEKGTGLRQRVMVWDVCYPVHRHSRQIYVSSSSLKWDGRSGGLLDGLTWSNVRR